MRCSFSLNFVYILATQTTLLFSRCQSTKNRKRTHIPSAQGSRLPKCSRNSPIIFKHERLDKRRLFDVAPRAGMLLTRMWQKPSTSTPTFHSKDKLNSAVQSPFAYSRHKSDEVRHIDGYIIGLLKRSFSPFRNLRHSQA